MKTKWIFMCITLVIILVSKSEGRGGGRGRGGGGGRGGRISGRSSIGSSSSWSFFGGGSKRSSNSAGGTHNSHSYNAASSHTGGWFHGFLHSSPYHYTYRPIYISNTHYSPGSRQSYYSDPEQQTVRIDTTNNLDEKEDATNYALGYTISKALGNNFLSIFNVVYDISKYPDQIKNKNTDMVTSTSNKISTSTTTTTTTTETPASTYDYFNAQKNVNTFSSTEMPIDESSYAPKTTNEFNMLGNLFQKYESDLKVLGALDETQKPTVPKTDYLGDTDLLKNALKGFIKEYPTAEDLTSKILSGG